jgi:hypothetical protein
VTNADDMLDGIDSMVFSEVSAIRRLYVDACERLNLVPGELSNLVIGERSVG